MGERREGRGREGSGEKGEERESDPPSSFMLIPTLVVRRLLTKTAKVAKKNLCLLTHLAA